MLALLCHTTQLWRIKAPPVWRNVFNKNKRLMTLDRAPLAGLNLINWPTYVGRRALFSDNIFITHQSRKLIILFICSIVAHLYLVTIFCTLSSSLTTSFIAELWNEALTALKFHPKCKNLIQSYSNKLG